MAEIIPSQRIKIIPWPEEENLVVCKHTQEKILFVGLGMYLRSLKKNGKKRHVDNSNHKPKTPV
jgi:hypothetical protein